jgi:hypothetical protein
MVAASSAAAAVINLGLASARTINNSITVALLKLQAAEALHASKGPCCFHLPGTTICSNINMPLKMCGFNNCCILVHHLCQVEWESWNGYEETTTLWCSVHHLYVLTLQVPPPLPIAPIWVLRAAAVMAATDTATPSSLSLPSSIDFSLPNNIATIDLSGNTICIIIAIIN